MAIAGVVFLLDACLPASKSPAQVDRHFTTVEQDTTQRGTAFDTRYNIEFLGGRVPSCSVGYHTYSTLRDGDQVLVTSTKLLKFCLRIERGAEQVYESKHRRLFQGIFAFLLLAVAFGWLRTNDDGGVVIYP